MNKAELIEMIKSLDIPFNEGMQNDNDSNVFPRVVFFEMSWDGVNASGTTQETVVRYQISFFSNKPRDKKLIELRNMLIENEMPTDIYHEFIEQPFKQIHSFMAIDILENLSE